MRNETLNVLLTARALFERASKMCLINDKYQASAGLVVLQDAIELVLTGALLEIGADNEVALDHQTFDQLLGELKKRGIAVQKSGMLKALNKQRVIVKHYGQMAEPATVRSYLQAAALASDSLLKATVGKTLSEIVIAGVLRDPEVREQVARSTQLIDEGDFLGALIAVRRALYLGFERDYSIYGWRNKPKAEHIGLLESGALGGAKAPYYTKNKEWIDANVRNPLDYIQLDHEKIRLDLLEWDISTQDFWNVWRLTPGVFQNPETKEWAIKLDMRQVRAGATEANARYCLDRTVALLLRKQSHFDLSRHLEYRLEHAFSVRPRHDQPLFSKASTSSDEVGMVAGGQTYDGNAMVSGIEAGQFIQIFHIQRSEPRFLTGYVSAEHCELLEGRSDEFREAEARAKFESESPATLSVP